MLNRLLSLTLGGMLASALCCGVAADHQRGFFAGGGAVYTAFDTAMFDGAVGNQDEIHPLAIELVGGYKYNNWLGVDLRYAKGLADRSLSAEEAEGSAVATIDYSLDGFTSVYYRPEITNEEARLYFLIGYSSVDLSVSNLDDADASLAAFDFSESGSSYGLGIGWYIDKRLSFNIEYRMLLDDKDTEVEAASASMDYRF